MTPIIITADADSVELALAEVDRAFQRQPPSTELAPGVWLLAVAEDWSTVTAQWRAAPPIFVRHLCPVQAFLPLAGVLDADLAGIEAVIEEEFRPLVDPSQKLSVQTRLLADLPYKPYDLNTALAATLAQTSGVEIDVRAPQQIFSVVCADLPRTQHSHHLYQGAGLHACLGLSEATDNLSNWAGGMRRFAREEGQISRAEFKLLEALEVFGIDLPANGTALDLGAAPGGWTRVLRQREQYVTAVDPGALDPRLAQDRRVRHRRLTAEAYLAGEPDRFDLIVNDMRMDARDSARLMVDYAPYLYPHGLAIMTLKLPEQHRQPLVEHACAILRRAYHIAGARQLFHNRSEITVYLKPS